MFIDLTLHTPNLTMISVFKTHLEIKYIRAIILAIMIVQLSANPNLWKEILFLGQAVVVEIFLIFLLHAVNTRLIRDFVALKGLLRKPQEKRPEKCFERSNRIVMEALKNKTPARHRGKMVSQRNRGNRMKPYEVKM